MASRKLHIVAGLGGALGCLVLGAPAVAAGAGGAPAPSASGGLEFGAAAKPVDPRPVATLFRVAPQKVTAGAAPPSLTLRIDQRGVDSVAARVVFLPLARQGQILRIDLGRVQTGRRIQARWPRKAVLAPGQYTVRLHAKAPDGATLLRRAHTAGRTTLTVVAPKPKPVPAPPVAPAPITHGGVFPVAGPHSFGGPDARFGAPRTGHIHEGQDVLAVEGIPVVAPLAGTISFTGDQPSSAGLYIVEHASDGRDFFFAHCQEGSVAVAQGAAVLAGQQLCRVGTTGDAEGPHLHFEIWVGGWRVNAASHPIDPLPDLQAWDAAASAARG